MEHVRSYESPPRQPQSWRPDRPGDSDTGFERGDRFGAQGPDQGYVYVLARRFEGQLQLAADEREEGALVGHTGGAPQRLFAEVASPYHYPEQRRVVDLVRDDVLRRTPGEIAEAHRSDWRSLLSV